MRLPQSVSQTLLDQTHTQTTAHLLGGLPEAQQNDKSRDEGEEGQGMAHGVQHPEAHHQLFEPQLGRQRTTEPPVTGITEDTGSTHNIFIIIDS